LTDGRLDETALRAAAFEVARNALWRRGPVDVGAIEELTERIVSDALGHEPYVTGRDRDPNLIVHALNFVAACGAFPPMGASAWYSDVLLVLIELACPNAAGRPAMEPFFQEVEKGIAESRADIAECQSRRQK
jgi:hypothetical protein